jgi:HlyD family secretion protein
MQRGGTVEERIFVQADLSHAQLEESAAESSLDRIQALQRDGAASDAEVRGATRRVQDARATLDAIKRRMSNRFSPADKTLWKARVQEAKMNLAAANVTLANANIVTPIAGTVYLLPVSLYDFVSPGADLMHVADLDHLQVRALFDEPDMGKLHVGAPVELHWEGRLDRTWHGVIEHVPMAATASGVRNVGESIIAVEDAHGDLPANTNVNIIVRVEHKSHVVTLPREALHTHGVETYVYRVINGTLVRTAVRTGLMNLSDVEITGGLSLTDTVALHAVDNRDLTDGMKVKTRA